MKKTPSLLFTDTPDTAAAYTDSVLYSTAHKPKIDGTIFPGEYGAWFDAAYTSGDKAPQTRYYLGWTPTDLYYAVKMKIDVSGMTDAEKAALIHRIHIHTFVYRGDYRKRTEGDPAFTQFVTESQDGTYKFRYVDKDGVRNAHAQGSTRLVYSVTENKSEGCCTVIIEHRFRMDNAAVLPTSTTAEGVYTVASVVTVDEGADAVSKSYLAPGTEKDGVYTMGCCVVSTTDKMSEKEAPDDEAAERDNTYLNAVTTKFDGYTVTLSEPIVVFQGEEDDDAWGHTNFPKVGRTEEGFLRVWWTYGQDKIGATGNVKNVRVSEDEGKSWLPLGVKDSTAPPDRMMKNGKCWGGFSPMGEPTSHELAALIPDSEKVKLNGGCSLILTKDLEKYDLAKELKLTSVSIREYDPVSGTYETIPCTINWPYNAVTLHPGDIFASPARWFSMGSGSTVLASDGSLYVGIYALGFDADAATFADAVAECATAGKSRVYIFKSTDCGRTWDYQAQFCAPAESSYGFSEPDLIEMRDGSLFMLMRSGHTDPVYSAVSHDGGETWTAPVQFDVCGVRPHLLGLDCGVTVATYGRPYQFIRTTADPTGVTWDEHIVVPLSNTNVGFMNQSCFNNTLLKIDGNSAWLCYTDFQVPNENGWGVKSVLLRKITVTMDE